MTSTNATTPPDAPVRAEVALPPEVADRRAFEAIVAADPDLQQMGVTGDTAFAVQRAEAVPGTRSHKPKPKRSLKVGGRTKRSLLAVLVGILVVGILAATAGWVITHRTASVNKPLPAGGQGQLISNMPGSGSTAASRAAAIARYKEEMAANNAASTGTATVVKNSTSVGSNPAADTSTSTSTTPQTQVKGSTGGTGNTVAPVPVSGGVPVTPVGSGGHGGTTTTGGGTTTTKPPTTTAPQPDPGTGAGSSGSGTSTGGVPDPAGGNCTSSTGPNGQNAATGNQCNTGINSGPLD